MRPSRVSLKRSLLLAAFAGVSVFSATAAAQNPNPNTSTSNNNNSPQPATSSPASTNTPTTQTSQPPTTSTGPSTPQITGGTSDTVSRDIPSITGPGGGSAGGPATLPTLSRAPVAIPTYPPPGVPPTNQAPFMQHSTLPEGTVFIAVGAILGAFGLTVLIWRAIIACLLHRDVERAALAQHAANDKAAGSFPAPPAPFYKSYGDSGSNPNLFAGGGMGVGAGAAGVAPAGSSASLAGRGVRRSHRGPTPSATPSQSNLFFSPTAASGLGGGGGSVSNRDSRFLPSGFYAAGSGSPNNGPRHEHSISLSNLRPDSRGHARAVSGITPPESPSLHPARHGSTLSHSGAPGVVPRNVSTSSLNLNTPPVGRAPSAYLEDMLDDPTGHPMPSPSPVGRTGSYYGGNTPSPGPQHPLNHSPQSRTFSPPPNGGRF